MSSNQITNKKLSSLVIKVDNKDWQTIPLSDSVYTFRGELFINQEPNNFLGTITINAIVTDIDGKQATASIKLKLKTDSSSPIIAILNEEGYIQDGAVINFFDTINFSFMMTSSIASGKELSKLVVIIDDWEWESINLTGSEYTYRSSVIFEPARDSFTVLITATVTDIAGEEATVTLNLSLIKTLIPTCFIWNRHGATAAIGLEEFGLQWTSNSKDYIYANITPLEGASLFEFDPSVWNNTITEADKASLFSEQAIPISLFNKVSAMTSSDYDYVIGTTYLGMNYLIHITKGVVVSYKGVDITISGEWK